MYSLITANYCISYIYICGVKNSHILLTVLTYGDNLYSIVVLETKSNKILI